VITTIIYALLAPVFFEMDNVFGEEKNFDDNNGKTTYSQQVVETKECKSPCQSSAEMLLPCVLKNLIFYFFLLILVLR
jgi:hypothetical protein